jgi:hypothetical protein
MHNNKTGLKRFAGHKHSSLFDLRAIVKEESCITISISFMHTEGLMQKKETRLKRFAGHKHSSLFA